MVSSGCDKPRLAERLPAVRRERGIAQVGEQRPPGVRRERDRVRIRHHVRRELAQRRHVNGHLERVLGAAPPLLALGAPGTVVVAAHRHTLLVEQQRHVLGSRRPQRQARAAVPPRRTEVGVVRRGVEVVEHARDLQAGRLHQRAGGVVFGHDELSREQAAGLRARLARQLQRLVGGQVRMARAHAGREPGLVQRQWERGPACDRPVLDREAALGRRVQPVAEAVALVRKVPRDQAVPHPVGGALASEDLRRVVGDHVGGVVIREGDIAAGRLERDVGAARRAAGAVVLVPCPVDRHLVVVVAGRDGERRAVHAPADELQRRRGALRLPVAGAAELGLERADQRHGARRGRVVGLSRSGQGKRRQRAQCRA